MGPNRDASGDEPWESPADVAPPAPAPLTPGGRPVRATRPTRLPPVRAVAGAMVAVAGVALGISTLLWATGGLQVGPGDPSVRPPGASSAGTTDSLSEPSLDEPAVALEEGPAAAEVVDPAPPEPVPPAESVPPPPAPPPPAPAPSTPPPAPAPSQPAPQHAAPVEVPILVLNNSRVPGLAARAAQRFEAGGWPVRETGNLRGRIRATTVYYPPGQEAAARELAGRFPGVARVLPRLANLPGTGLTVVVTRDFCA
jgi:hypothetical protein